jgi:MFS family permease
MRPSTNRWLILGLTALSAALLIGAPSTGLSVLFGEISAELHFDLVQVGLIWGIGSLPSIFTGFLSGAVIDRFGPKSVLIAGIVLVSLAAAVRGLAGGLASFLAAILAFGCVVPLVVTAGYKLNSLLFPSRLLGIANGIQSMGVGLGFFLGSLLSANVLSPLLGGWRHVFFFFGGSSLLLVLPWYFVRLSPAPHRGGAAIPHVPVREALGRVAHLKDLWLLGLAFFGVAGCLQGIAGYLPLHLRAIGWEGGAADGAFALLNAASLVCILPLAFLSGRLGPRKRVMAAGLLAMSAGSAWLGAAAGASVWAAVALTGMARDGSVAVGLTMAVETPGVGPAYAGTATGMVMSFFYLAGLFAPPFGNKLAEFAPGAPFLFWAGMAALGVVSLLAIRGSAAAGDDPSPSASFAG